MRRPIGKINLIGVVMLAAVAAGIYTVIFFSGTVLDNFDVKEQLAAAYNQGTKLDDNGIRRFLEDELGRVGEHEVTDEFGNTRIARGLGLKDEDITVERNENAGTILIRIDYTRSVQLKPLQKIVQVHFKPQVAGPILKRF